MKITKQLLTTLALVLAHCFVSAQAYIGPDLQKKLNSNSNHFIKVHLLLQQQYNIDSLVQEFRKNNTKAKQRGLITIQALTNFAQKTQRPILEQIKNSPQKEVKNVKPFWAINLITLEAKPAFIQQLALNRDVGQIQVDKNKYELIEPLPATKPNRKAASVAEPGIYAIHAPELWKMGYTGKNRIVLGVDTGVKSAHEALSDRFLGNFRPLQQSWFGYNNSTPEDVALGSLHGTHTLGTVLGLNKAAHDTIGVAFNAFWMASDPIVAKLTDVRGLDDIVACFEWALNPDYNIETVNDMPDVITNSWGWDSFYNNNNCDIPEVQLLNAVAAAGIGVVFSAGNDGPEMGTIGQPANLATTELNVFSVGAVDANTPCCKIADFSSRGPTSCISQEDGFSKWVKPEVVAPGVNVRSAQDVGKYGALSGTSMAAPHVAGAFLLLKEAFPFLPGEDILWALYHTATDLGETGEDNTYGNGMVNAKAAFDYLAEKHKPVPPVDALYDIALQGVRNIPTTYTFESSISPQVVVFNQGSSTVQGINVSIRVKNNHAVTETFTTTIAPGDEAVLTVPGIALQQGKNNLALRCGLTIDYPESSEINNTKHLLIHVPKTTDLPFSEDFEDTDFYLASSDVIVLNHNTDWTWAIDTAGGLPNSTQSLRIDFTKMKYRKNQHDEVLTPLLVIPETDREVNLRFRHAYAPRLDNLFKDSLIVLASTDKGRSWSDTLWSKGAVGLATLDDNMGSQRFVPQAEEEWSTTFINLNAYKGKELLISFKTTNDNGSNLYLDDIMVYEGRWPEAIGEGLHQEKLAMQVYPNPAQHHIKVMMDGKTQISGQFAVLNGLGNKLLSEKCSNCPLPLKINTSKLSPGVYLLEFKNAETKQVVRFIKL